MYCKNCGTFLKDGTRFCTNCGAAVNSENRATGYETRNRAPAYDAAYRAPAYNPPVTVIQQTPSYDPPLSPWAYFGYSLLYAIPFVGLVLLIIHSFSDANINRKNFARSHWCALLVVMAIVFILVLCGVSTSDIADLFGW